jgi:hypothetical protein
MSCRFYRQRHAISERRPADGLECADGLERRMGQRCRSGRTVARPVPERLRRARSAQLLAASGASAGPRADETLVRLWQVNVHRDDGCTNQIGVPSRRNRASGHRRSSGLGSTRKNTHPEPSRNQSWDEIPAVDTRSTRYRDQRLHVDIDVELRGGDVAADQSSWSGVVAGLGHLLPRRRAGGLPGRVEQLGSQPYVAPAATVDPQPANHVAPGGGCIPRSRGRFAKGLWCAGR